MINTIGNAIRLIKRIDEPNVGILCDTFHMTIEEKNIYQAITSAGSRLFHVHVCSNDRGIPGSGQVRWDNLFKGLKEIDYNETISIEGFVDDTADVASGACIWRKFASSAEEMAKTGLKFISSMLKKYEIR